jgi:hypothetical protein
VLPGLAGESKSYAERLFSFPDIGALSAEDTAKAVQDPAKAAGVLFKPAALDEVATATVVSRLDQNFFRVRYDRLTPTEKNFLRAMAELGPGPQRTGDIADTLKVKVTSLGPVRAKLIKKGMTRHSARLPLGQLVPSTPGLCVFPPVAPTPVQLRSELPLSVAR